MLVCRQQSPSKEREEGRKEEGVCSSSIFFSLLLQGETTHNTDIKTESSSRFFSASKDKDQRGRSLLLVLVVFFTT